MALNQADSILFPFQGSNLLRECLPDSVYPNPITSPRLVSIYKSDYIKVYKTSRGIHTCKPTMLEAEAGGLQI